MRARNLKPGLFQNEVLGAADPLFTILFEGLWCMADREGRLEDRPLKICAGVFPYRRKISEKHVDTMLWWLDEHGFIARYQIGAEVFIEVLEFPAHQNPHKDERPSKIQAFSHDLHRSQPVQQPKSHRGKTKAIGLIPDSGFLIPDSGLLTADSYHAEVGPGVNPVLDGSEGKPAVNGHGTGASEDWQAFQRIQSAYPNRAGRLDWGRAEHFCHALIERHGETWESLEQAAQRYAQYTRATGAERTQHVLMPGNFFNPTDLDKPWQQPWDLPDANAPGKPGPKRRWHPDDGDPTEPKQATS